MDRRAAGERRTVPARSSAGRAFAEVGENFHAYALDRHRHCSEIEQWLRPMASDANCMFVPHMLPMVREIHSTLYARLAVREPRGLRR